MFRGNELMKLLSMIALLLLVGMLVVRSRDPNLYRWFTNESAEQPASDNEAPAGPPVAQEPTGTSDSPPDGEPKRTEERPLAATGPTDEDEEEAAAAEEEFQAILDGALAIQPEEMVTYQRVLRWVQNQPYPVLRKRAEKEKENNNRSLVFNDFYQQPSKHRGKIVALDLTVRRVVPCELEGQSLYEIWGFTTESQGWLYAAVVPELPPGFPDKQDVNEKATLVGYFYKLQGYHPGNAKPNAKPLKSPLIIGRLQGRVVRTPHIEKSDYAWGYGLAALFGLVMIVRLGFMLLGRRRKKRLVALNRSEPPLSPKAVEAWLEQAGPVSIGQATVGNNAEANHESGNGKPGGR